MDKTTLTAVVAAPVAAAGTFTVAYNTAVQADFTVGQTVNVLVYGSLVACAVTFGASVATITWPSGAAYALPADSYIIDFDLIGGGERDVFTRMDNQAISTAATVADAVIDLNLLLAKLKVAGLMTPD